MKRTYELVRKQARGTYQFPIHDIKCHYRAAYVSRTHMKDRKGELQVVWVVNVLRMYNQRNCWVRIGVGKTLLRALRKAEKGPKWGPHL